METHRTAAAQHTLLPKLIDDLAQSEPDALWGLYPTAQNSYDNGFTPITYQNFAIAVDKIAHLMHDTLSSSKDGEVLAYLAPSDARCTTSLVAAMKSGFQLFLMSERNSVAGQLKLLDDLQCSVLVTTDRSMPAVQAVLDERQLTVIELPALTTLFQEPQQSFAYNKQYAESHDETAFIVHTSSSTGFPKPMRISHAYISRAASNIGLPAPEGYDMLSEMIGRNRNILLLPLGHPAGVQFGLFNPFFNGTTVILPLSNAPPTPNVLLEILEHTHADWACLAPLTLQALSKDLQLVDKIAEKLDMILFSGGSLPNVFGDVLAKKIKLTSLLGSSESGPLPLMYAKNYDFNANWNYMQVHPAVGAVFDPIPGGIAELIFKRSAECEHHQTVFTLFPQLTEFRTRDLFTQHSSLPDVWTHASRSDDVIVFLNGEKVNPIAYESHVSKHPDIAGAVMFGAQRFEAGLLIELSSTTELTSFDLARVIDKIWPTIEEANRLVPVYAQVSQSHVCFTDAGTPILRTLKGTLRRKETLNHYSAKIEKLYSDADQIWAFPDTALPRLSENELGRVIQTALDDTGTKLSSETDNFFSMGMDSLHALRLAQRLKVKTGLRLIQPSLIYLHPTIQGLAQAIAQSAQNAETSQKEEQLSRRENLDRVYAKFAGKLDALKPVGAKENNITHKDKSQVVLLTGSTGHIGSYLLRTLMAQTFVKHVYCLNRATDSQDLQTERNIAIDPTLPTEFPDSKVTFLTTDFSDCETLGLSTNVYHEIQQSITHLIHNAWAVNFNLPLSAFNPMLESVVALTALCASAPHSPTFAFISSISLTFNHGANDTVTEALLSAQSLPPTSGYAESKYVVERLLQHATEVLRLGPCFALRMGQIAGPSKSPGLWNVNDWVAALARSSKHLGAIPDSLNIHGQASIDWLPIDDAADVIAQVVLGADGNDNGHGLVVCHPLNPNKTTWSELLPSILKAADGSPNAMEVVKPEVWLSRLKASANEGLDDSAVEKNPALRLMGFWETSMARNSGGVTWITEQAQQMSPRLSDVGKIQGEWMEKWCRQWFESC